MIVRILRALPVEDVVLAERGQFDKAAGERRRSLQQRSVMLPRTAVEQGIGVGVESDMVYSGKPYRFAFIQNIQLMFMKM
ncbi:hypothetical protein BMF90_04225 [Serratia sp. OLHL2]|nr:hypothetical protein L085_10405 [Serratia sp. FS14]NMM73864.1 hypothetical protein [Serratia marcescens]ODJ13975.1 hypothetical protein BBC05_17895 [Serratia sp. ISTD04]PII54094.1 hypothetical protein BMF87_07535 [Serratia sp. OLEL1]PII56716.1 hypothetical protein BMF85_15130 [Serratia sp. OLCL1]PII59687.1 hypothetical protein BMF92_15625 [Serratia sp. OLBL1]PII66537.1 hypothetical protein BMF90_04225 [Serratia sp. OLHL2]PII72576.1 hypothetical protein BMH23_15775 [Serratia sp. OLIL2]PII